MKQFVKSLSAFRLASKVVTLVAATMFFVTVNADTSLYNVILTKQAVLSFRSSPYYDYGEWITGCSVSDNGGNAFSAYFNSDYFDPSVHIESSSQIRNLTYDIDPFSGVEVKIIFWPGRHSIDISSYGSISLLSFKYLNGESVDMNAAAKIVSSHIRDNDPTILDVVYKVSSKMPTVKVRVLAFEDGERSFAKVVRPETFVNDTNGVATACNVGDKVTPNVEHTISWRVSSDWKTKLAKVKFEVLASGGELLPLELMTIPASDQYGKMKISWNAISVSQWFDALLWLYADKDADLTLSNGTLRNNANDQELASGTNLTGGYTYYDSNGNYVGRHWEINSVVPSFIFNKMGYSLLTGAPLTYANSETRLGLSPTGERQYAYKIVEE